jgi:hypothetical protein
MTDSANHPCNRTISLKPCGSAPFRPFQIHLSDGTIYDVDHPEMVMVGRSSAMVFFPPKDLEPPAFDRYEAVALSHIARMVPVETAATS